MPTEINRRLWSSIQAMDATAWLADIRVPVLGIYGGRGRNDAEKIRKQLFLDRVPNLDFILVPRSAHFVMWEAPSLLESSLRSFVSRVS